MLMREMTVTALMAVMNSSWGVPGITCRLAGRIEAGVNKCVIHVVELLVALATFGDGSRQRPHSPVIVVLVSVFAMHALYIVPSSDTEFSKPH